jgi:aldehyde:ferredoxin oxidoreductase
MPTLEAYASWYRGKPDEIVKDLDIPKELVENWFKLDILHHDKYEGKAHLVKYYEENNAIADALGVCKFTTSWRFGVGPQRLAKLLSAATGIEYTWRDLLRCGERIWTVEYAMQRRFGLRRKDDYPPERVFKEPIPDGPAKGAKISLEKYEKMLDEYYQIRGYNHEGIPTRQKLEELGLKDVADDLERRGILKQSPA